MSTPSDPSSPSFAGSAAILNRAAPALVRSEPADNVHPDLAALMTSGVASGISAQGVSTESAEDLFERLILPESEIMFRVALSLTRNRADAEDLVQESLLKAYRAIHTFDGRYPRAWVLTIVRNTERNRHRRRRPELLADPELSEDQVPKTSVDEVELRAESRELGGAIAQAVGTLPANFQRVVQLVDIDGLTYQEAAELIRVPLGTVMSRLHRARRRLRELLLPQGFGPEGVSTESRAVPALGLPPTPDQALLDESICLMDFSSLVAEQSCVEGSDRSSELLTACAR
ncbi:MAG: RNA polymerase sigma factor [Actinomycetes bacterium]